MVTGEADEYRVECFRLWIFESYIFIFITALSVILLKFVSIYTTTSSIEVSCPRKAWTASSFTTNRLNHAHTKVYIKVACYSKWLGTIIIIQISRRYLRLIIYFIIFHNHLQTQHVVQLFFLNNEFLKICPCIIFRIVLHICVFYNYFFS